MASTYLTKTFGSAGNRKTWTWSAWIKKAKPSGGDGMNVLSAFASTSDRTEILLQSSGNFRLLDIASSTNLETSALYRDVNGWYHFVISLDTTQATSTNRVKIYVNGEQITSFSSSTYPAQNADLQVNSSVTHDIGRTGAYTNEYFDGSMTHVHFIDGTAYDASAFGETDATTGIWKAKTAPSVTYGTNGFFLKFENSGSMGTDSSGNANNFTVNGTPTQTVDTPSNVFATMNPLNAYYSGSSFSNGNLTFTTGTSQYSSDLATLGVSSGKYYWEIEFDVDNAGNQVAHIGIKSSYDTNTSSMLGGNTNDYAYRGFNGEYMTGGTSTAYGNTYTAGDIIGVALDLDNNKLYFSKNGTWQNSGDPTSGATGTGAISITDPASTNFGVYIPAISYNTGSFTGTFKCNFGNGYFGTTAVASGNADDNGLGIFEYAPPTGYLALCTKNINEQEYA